MGCLCVWSVAYAQTKLNDRPVITPITNIPEPTPPPKSNEVGREVRGNGTPIRASKTISEDALREFLESKSSPLSGNVRQIAQSPYWSTIIAISAAEQSFYKQPATSPFNMWGRMFPRCCILKKYSSWEEAIADQDAYMRDYWEARGYTTIESLNGRYVYPASSSWLNTVLKIKQEVENL